MRDQHLEHWSKSRNEWSMLGALIEKQLRMINSFVKSQLRSKFSTSSSAGATIWWRTIIGFEDKHGDLAPSWDEGSRSYLELTFWPRRINARSWDDTLDREAAVKHQYQVQWWSDDLEFDERPTIAALIEKKSKRNQTKKKEEWTRRERIRVRFCSSMSFVAFLAINMSKMRDEVSNLTFENTQES